MNHSVVCLYTVGQTPRPDLTRDVAERFDRTVFETVGALDGLSEADIPACALDGYPLETSLRDGTRVVVAAAFLEPLLQQAIAEWDDRVAAHLVLCAGPFPGLAARSPLILPFDVGVHHLAERGLGSLEVVVPFAAQVHPASRKWRAAGFFCRTHALAEKPRDLSVPQWLNQQLASVRASAPASSGASAVAATRASADALVFDYVGLPAETVDEVAAQVDIPVFDLGRLAMDTLDRTLQEL